MNTTNGKSLEKSEIKRRVSYKAKVANDNERQIDLLKLYSGYSYLNSQTEDIDKYKINYDLMNGRMDVKNYEDPYCLNIDNEQVKIGDIPITHYPLTQQFAKVLVGEMIARPFKPIAKEIGEFSHTVRSKKFNELLRGVVTTRIIDPIRDQATKEFMSQLQGQNLQGFSEQDIQKMQQEIDNRTKSKTPEEILDFMVNDFRTPTQRQAQQLLDFFVDRNNFKYLQIDGFKHALPTGKEVYYVGDRHGEPVMELTNPMHIRWGGSRNTEWVQDATWVTYDRFLTVEDAQQEYAEYLAEMTNDELKMMIEPVGGLRQIGDPKKDDVMKSMIIDLSEEGSSLAKKYKDVNYKTKAGQNSIANLYTDVIKKYGGTYGSDIFSYGIRATHTCWRDMCKMKYVVREIEGEEKGLWFSEHYEEIPEDLEVIDVWINEIWEGTRLGSSDSELFVRVQRLPNMYPSRYNPWGTKLPYYGKLYDTHMNNSKNVAWIDLGKIWQKEYDVTASQLKHDMKTDLGLQFLIFLELKPEGWKWQQWLNTMKDTGLMMSTIKRHGGSIDPNFMRAVDLSRVKAIAEKIQFLSFIRENMIQSLNLNDARVGAIGQYTTNQNAQQSQNASYNQTEAYFETHRQIVEKALNAFMNQARCLYKYNNKRFFILDDVARTELEITPDAWYEEWAIQFSTSSDEIRKVQELKQQMQAFVQNQMSFDGILGLALADTTSDIEDLMKVESKRMESIRQQSIQTQQEQFQAGIAAQKEQKDSDRQMMMQMKQADNQTKLIGYQLDSEKFRKAGDSNANGQADMLEKSEMELMVKKLIEERKAELKKYELDIKAHEAGLTAGLKGKELEIMMKDSETKAKEVGIAEGLKHKELDIREKTDMLKAKNTGKSVSK
jgi:hypothetical protein